MSETQTSITATNVVTEGTSDFSALLMREFKPKTDHAREAVEAAVQTLAEQALAHTTLIADDSLRTIQAIVAALDQKLTEQVNAIMHHEDFQRMESGWRGLEHLVKNTETDEMLRIRIFDISKKELGRTLRKFRGTAWDQSPIFKKVYEEEYGQFGGEPFGVMIGDYYVRSRSAGRAAAGRHGTGRGGGACAVHRRGGTVGDADGELGRTGQSARSDEDLPDARVRRLAQPARERGLRVISACACRASWRACRTAPRPIRSTSSTSRRTPKAPTAQKYCWANSAYAMATNITRAFKLYGWCTRIRGIESGGAVEALPTHTFPSDDGGVAMKCPTEIAISDRREAELAKNGFMPLIHKKNSDFAAFIGAQSLQKPQEYDDPNATANANLSARLPYLFASCRFAHYLKCMVRDKIGSSMTKTQLTEWLQTWLNRYVDGSPDTSSEEWKASHPLAEGRVDVEENEENPGYYNAKFFLKPHYQLEGLTVSLRLVSRMPK